MADWGDCSARCGEGIRRRRVECKIFLEFSKTIATLEDSKCPGPKPAETEICFAGLYSSDSEQNTTKRLNELYEYSGCYKLFCKFLWLALAAWHKDSRAGTLVEL